MAKLPRVTQKIFAQNSGTNDVTVFGTAKNGSDAVFTKDISQIMNSDAFSQGWGSATLTDDAPFQEDMNGIQLALSQQLAYFFENGMPEWDENTTYYANTSFCQVNGVWYQSLTDNNIGNNPVNDTTNWYKIDLDKLNPDLSNLSATGLDKINQSKALETGSISSDADVYADVLKYKNSGTGTGIDTIKPDEYTVTGTPSISETGIASNLGNGNKIQCNTFTLADLKNKSWKAECEINVVDLNTSDTANISTHLLKFCDNWYTYGSITCFYNHEINRFDFRLNTRVDDDEGWYCHIAIPVLTEDIKRLKIIATFEKDAETQNYKIKVFNADTGEQLGDTGNYTPATDKKELDIIDDLPTQSPLLGEGAATQNWTTYDLNTYKFYIEDELVWQPCLKIPYTESKTGSKIVDAAYRDRVQDMYEQFGYAPYYTIDEENQNFTLPMGEIYGMIERKNNELNNPFSLFDYKYTDAPIYNASWLKADGTFSAKSVYVSAYEALVVENNSDITAGTTTTLPSGGSYTKRGLSVKLSTASYTDTDFVINTTDETFRLPLTTKAVPFAGGSFPVVGTGIALGLTNARDSCVLTLQSNSDGAEINVKGGGQTLPYNAGGINRPENGYVMGLSKDSSKSGVVANVSGTTGLNLYFYVGETVQNAYLIDAGQIAENMDGSWTKKLLVLENNTTIATDSTGKLYDLSDYLPEDNNVYEILFAAAIRTGAQANSYMAISQQVGSGWGVLANVITRTNSYLESGGSAIGIIMSDRKLQISWTATVSSGTLLYLRILAYRKVR